MCLLSLKNQSYMICSSTFTFVLSFIQHFPQVWSAFWTSTSRVWRASRRPTSTATTSLYSRHPWRFSSKDYKVMVMVMGMVMHYHDGNAGRGTETEDSLQKRLTQAAADLEWVPTFNTITTIDCIKTANIITYQLILIKTIIRYGTSKGNFDIVITNNDIEDAYAEFLAFLKARYLCLSWTIANPYSQLWAEQPKHIFNQMLSPMNIASK